LGSLFHTTIVGNASFTRQSNRLMPSLACQPKPSCTRVVCVCGAGRPLLPLPPPMCMHATSIYPAQPLSFATLIRTFLACLIALRRPCSFDRDLPCLIALPCPCSFEMRLVLSISPSSFDLYECNSVFRSVWVQVQLWCFGKHGPCAVVRAASWNSPVHLHIALCFLSSGISALHPCLLGVVYMHRCTQIVRRSARKGACAGLHRIIHSKATNRFWSLLSPASVLWSRKPDC